MTEKSKAALELARGVVRGNKEVFLSKPQYVPDEAQRARLYEAYYIKMAHEFKMLKRNFFEYHLDVDIHTLDCMLRAHGSVVEEMYGDGMSQEFMARMEAIWEDPS